MMESLVMTMLRAVRERLKNISITLGKDPRHVSPGTVIICPVIADTLHCGLAGILTVKTGEKRDGGFTAAALAKCFRKIEAHSFERLMDPARLKSLYLGGPGTMEELDRAILRLKWGSSLEEVFFTPGEFEKLELLARKMGSFLEKEEARVERHLPDLKSEEMESANTMLLALKDSLWALTQDIIASVPGILFLASRKPEKITREEFRAYRKIYLILGALDRLEVRGRDSAGIQVSLELASAAVMEKLQKDIAKEGLKSEWVQRTQPRDLFDGAIRISGITSGQRRAAIAFTYKKASVTGALGENGKYLRDKIRNDRILRTAVSLAAVSDMYLGHTRWASVGSITESNCHPIDNFTVGTELKKHGAILIPEKDFPRYGKGAWTINVALNGDVDNYPALRASLEAAKGDTIDANVTTDTKIIPLMIENYLSEGYDLAEAFRRALLSFEGSHAIAMESNLEPGKVFLALRGSGQSLYIGISDDQYMFSSELYGLVEVTPWFVKLDGERERVAGNPKTRGQVIILDRRQGGLEGLRGWYYDGHPVDLSGGGVQKAEITTRDIDRKNYPHFLLKEILEAPDSVQKTMRGKYTLVRDVKGKTSVTFNLGDEIIPRRLRKALEKRTLTRIFVIGQGTAAVAGAAIAEALSKYLKG
ncbi:MAG: hypothetical protein NT072_10945, partial [Deltaproteobacteria bacterium]|nr:hypothetical protein [Deltaproteobacteria bacterium]